MSEGIQDRRDKLPPPDRRTTQDESIISVTQIIESEQDVKKKTKAYYVRGGIRFMRGEYELASADFTEAIKLEPRYAPAYNYRGLVYVQQNNYDAAFIDLSKAIDIDPTDAFNYASRGIAYIKTRSYERAIDDISDAMEIRPAHADFYKYRGLAHLYKGNRDQAIKDSTEAIKLDSKNSIAFYIRGRAYFEKEVYDTALDDFVSAAKYTHKLKFKFPTIYVACRIGSIYSTGNKRKRGESFKFCSDILNEIKRIQRRQFYAPQDSGVAHYTSLDLLQKFSGNICFRLYNAAYMNDPDEGRAFLEILPEEVKNFFYDKNAESFNLSPAYIGSFIVPNSGQCKDSLPLWRTYGKHGADEAAGACLIFKRECFAEHFATQIEGMKRRYVDDLLPRQQVDKDSNIVENKNIKPTLFGIIYVGTNKKSNKKTKKRISRIFNKLKKSLNKLKCHIESIDDSEKQSELKYFACELLDSIRFLVKTHHYEHEDEVRIMQLPHMDGKLGNSSDVRVDMDTIPPRFYLDTIESFQLSDVIFGPRARNVKEWEQWINQHDENIEVKKSDIKYGRQDS